MSEKALAWYKHTGNAVIYYLRHALIAMHESANPSRIPVAEKYMELAWYDLGMWPRLHASSKGEFID